MPDTLIDTGVTPGASGAELHIRELALPFSKSKIVQLEDGDLLIKDVPMLAEGEWTDAAVRTPLFYPAATLEKDAGNWIDNSGFNRHQFGVPRRSTDRVAEAVNPHYGQFSDNEGTLRNGVISDVRVYGFTQNGRDMQEMIKRKLIKFVSVEHLWTEQFNKTAKRLEAASLKFMGFALVPKGACSVCRFNEAPPTTPPPPTEPKTEDTMDPKELETAVAAAISPMAKELSELKAQRAEPVKAEVPKELTDLIKAQETTIKELSARLEKIEKTPAPSITAPPTEPVRELAEPEISVVFDKTNGTLRRA